MLQKLEKIIDSVENYPLTIAQFILGFSSIIALRMLGENLLLGFQGKSTEFFVGSVLVAYLFFLVSYIIILLFISLYLGQAIKKGANLLLWGFLIVIFPPIIDKILCGTQTCLSFYTFDGLVGLFHRFLTFFGDNPTFGITYGVRAEVALATLFLTIYFFIKSGKAWKSLLGGLGAYAIFFVLGSFPSWFTFVFLAPVKHITAIQGFDIAGMFFSPIHYFSITGGDILNSLNAKMNLIYAFLLVFLLIFFYFLNSRPKLLAIAKNVRWIQISIHAGLVLFGAFLGAFYFPKNLTLDVFSFLALANLVLAAVFAWIAAVFLNDYVDLEIDKLTNVNRPTVTGVVSKEEYLELFLVCFLLSLVLGLTVGVKFFLLILIYQIIGWAYSAWPFRLKRFAGIASFLSALALALLFLSGFILLADSQNIASLPGKVFWLLIIAFTVSLPIKDLKDIEGDKKDNVWTIPVLLGETWARFMIGFGIFVSYALSVVLLNARALFIPAMILGAVSFWILQNKKISPRRVHIFVFGILFVYVLLMGYFIFLPALMIRTR